MRCEKLIERDSQMIEYGGRGYGKFNFCGEVLRSCFKSVEPDVVDALGRIVDTSSMAVEAKVKPEDLDVEWKPIKTSNGRMSQAIDKRTGRVLGVKRVKRGG